MPRGVARESKINLDGEARGGRSGEVFGLGKFFFGDQDLVDPYDGRMGT